MTEDTNINQNAILKELSDIKSSLAVNTNETANIKASITEIKADIKDIKNDFITRREMTETLATLKEEISPLKKIVYGCVTLILIGFVGGILALVYK